MSLLDRYAYCTSSISLSLISSWNRSWIGPQVRVYEPCSSCSVSDSNQAPLNGLLNSKISVIIRICFLITQTIAWIFLKSPQPLLNLTAHLLIGLPVPVTNHSSMSRTWLSDMPPNCLRSYVMCLSLWKLVNVSAYWVVLAVENRLSQWVSCVSWVVPQTWVSFCLKWDVGWSCGWQNHHRRDRYLDDRYPRFTLKACELLSTRIRGASLT